MRDGNSCSRRPGTDRFRPTAPCMRNTGRQPVRRGLRQMPYPVARCPARTCRLRCVRPTHRVTPGPASRQDLRCHELHSRRVRGRLRRTDIRHRATQQPPINAQIRPTAYEIPQVSELPILQATDRVISQDSRQVRSTAPGSCHVSTTLRWPQESPRNDRTPEAGPGRAMPGCPRPAEAPSGTAKPLSSRWPRLRSP
jgi:hypothetical protein